ncbi:MAG: hypothetical protein HZA90_14015 [Verrucomicrobia bacterium]|nr:hypothetical protein [Verrucomicrobiota bacterium]
MSLKVFHLIFVAASILLAFGFGGWCFMQLSRGGGLGNLASGIGSLAVGAALIVYGRAVWRKLQQLDHE